MAEMKAAVIRRAGGPEVLQLETWPVPEPTAEQVLIRVKAFGLNRRASWDRRTPLNACAGLGICCRRRLLHEIVEHGSGRDGGNCDRETGGNEGAHQISPAFGDAFGSIMLTSRSTNTQSRAVSVGREKALVSISTKTRPNEPTRG
jgi:hypothetical protein